MSWGAVAGAGVSLIGGFLNKQSGDKAADTSQRMSEEDRKFAREQRAYSLLANSANQNSDYGSSSWEVDPETGRRTQTVSMNPAEKARLEDFRQIAANRMRAAGNIQFAQGPMNYQNMGLGHLANAAGMTDGTGDSGQRGPMPTGTMGRYAKQAGSGGGMMMRPPMGGGGGMPQGPMGPPQGGGGMPPPQGGGQAPMTPRYPSQQTPAPVTPTPAPAPAAPAPAPASAPAPAQDPAQASQMAQLLRWQAEQQRIADDQQRIHQQA